LRKLIIGYHAGEIENGSILVMQAIPSIVNTLDELHREINQFQAENG
jgi:hypothetical protein